jgi:hypothetical protein
LITQIRKFYNYLLGKTSELGDLNVKDVLLAKEILDIHRKRNHTGFHTAAFSSLKPIHAIDREVESADASFWIFFC